MAGSELALDALGLRGGLSLSGLSSLGAPSLADGEAVVSLVPLPERSSIDLDDSGLGQGVGTCVITLVPVSSMTERKSRCTYEQVRCSTDGRRQQ